MGRIVTDRLKIFGFLILWGSLSSFGLTSCSRPGVRASPPTDTSSAVSAPAASSEAASSTAASSESSSTAPTSVDSSVASSVDSKAPNTTPDDDLDSLQSRLPAEIPPTPVQPESTVLSKAATTADGDLLPASPQGDYQGPFRVGNQTQHPIRLALQTRLTPENESVVNPEGLDLEPVHWDFAPGEGGQSGLVMAVPQGDIELGNGDVLVAFAQDGSRRYWGPYIVGETQLPYWNEERQEWQLLIQP